MRIAKLAVVLLLSLACLMLQPRLSLAEDAKIPDLDRDRTRCRARSPVALIRRR